MGDSGLTTADGDGKECDATVVVLDWIGSVVKVLAGLSMPAAVEYQLPNTNLTRDKH